MITGSFGSNIGNYRFIWKIPEHVTLENALAENHSLSCKQNPAGYSIYEVRVYHIPRPPLQYTVKAYALDDCSASLSTHEKEVDKRLQEAIDRRP